MLKRFKKIFSVNKKNASFSPSPTFCVYPFMHFLAGPTEHNSLICCQSYSYPLKSENGKPYSLKQSSLEEIWNGKNMQEIRKKMLKGEKIPNCRLCYQEESLGLRSHRQNYNQQWLENSDNKFIIQNRILQSEANNYKAPPPLSLELKLGNHCNLQCRMCGPEYSSKIQKEIEELLAEDSSKVEKLIHIFRLESLKESKNWHESQKLSDSVFKWLPHIKTLYISGGETTLIKSFWKLINHIIETDYAKNISIYLTINCTYIPDKLQAMFPYFKKVQLFLSIDGFEQAYEYIRYPAKWSKIDKNVQILSSQVDKFENTNICVIPVAQIYNILNLPDLFIHWESLQKKDRFIIWPRLLFDPMILNIQILPSNVKKAALNKIFKYEDKYKRTNMGHLKHILKKDTTSTNHPLKAFREYTEMLDKKRGQSFKQSLPELYELLEEDGSWR